MIDGQKVQEYIDKWEQFDKNIVYDFSIGHGGIADCIKFFIYTLESCIKNNYKLYYKQNNIQIEKYIKLKYNKLYITNSQLQKLDNYTTINPHNIINLFLTSQQQTGAKSCRKAGAVGDINGVRNPISLARLDTSYFNFNHKIEDLFEFSDEVKLNRDKLVPPSIRDYISIHVRLGDKFLETDNNFIICKWDQRYYSNTRIYKFIEDNLNKNIFLCSDNNQYKKELKLRYKNLIIANSDIGHTGHHNTSQKQVLDTITEFYILTNSKLIFSGSGSGFSYIASQFKMIQHIGPKSRYDNDLSLDELAQLFLNTKKIK